MSELGKPRPQGGEVEDIVPEDVAQDEDYKRAVQSLEDQQHGRAGWLFARGALDKGDQAYLKEQEQIQRHAEEALQEREAAEFAVARVVAEKEALQRREMATRRGQGTATDATSLDNKKKELKVGKKKRLLPTIVKAKSREQEYNSSGNGASVTKKSKATAEERAEGQPLGKKEETAADDEEKKEEKEGGILAGLLGEYDSADSDDDGIEKKISSRPQQQQQNKTLPSAEDLLG
ncbi:hypothetical protein Ndes2437B_g05499 [Nannochloris sp. 'desiccata']